MKGFESVLQTIFRLIRLLTPQIFVNRHILKKLKSNFRPSRITYFSTKVWTSFHINCECFDNFLRVTVLQLWIDFGKRKKWLIFFICDDITPCKSKSTCLLNAVPQWKARFTTWTNLYKSPLGGGGSLAFNDEQLLNTFVLLTTDVTLKWSDFEPCQNKQKKLDFLSIFIHPKTLIIFQTQQSQTLSIPKEHHRYILGRGGTKLQELEQRTSTKISIPKATDFVDKITITGPKDGIEKAIHEINIISDQQSKQAYEVLPILKIYHPFINGPNGDYVKKLQADYPNVRVNIPPLAVNKNEIAVAGEKESVLKVAEIINKIAKDLDKKASTVSVEVKKSQHKYVVGPRGNAINEILADTGVFVEMPGSDSNSETITLRGPQEKLGLGKTCFLFKNLFFFKRGWQLFKTWLA